MRLKDLFETLGLSDLPKQARQRLTNALEHEGGQRGGVLLGRACAETVDALMESHGDGLYPEGAIALGTAAAVQMAANLRAAATLLEAYPAAQAAVVRAKTTGAKPEALKEARRVRDAATDALKEALGLVVLEG